MRLPKLTTLRRTSQIIFFLLFLFLLLNTEFRGSLRRGAPDIRIAYPVRWFLQIDPLVALQNALSGRVLYRGLLWFLAILIPTLFLGRFFCGWICPLGSIHHYFGSLRSEHKRGRRLVEVNRYRPWHTIKYYLLIAGLAAALVGSSILGWLDPIALLIRSLALSILPATNYALDAGLRALSHSRYTPVQSMGRLLHLVLPGWLLRFRQPYFSQAVWIALIFIFLVTLNFRITRFWCRALCPLGALLGIISRWSVLGLVKNAENCKDCDRCLLHCQGGDDPIGGVPWRQAECHLCLNCVADCPEGGLQFRFFPTQASLGANLRRRKIFTGLLAGAAIVPFLRSTPGFAVQRNERLLRPPGALDESSFLARCIRCGECMKVCPNNALQPTLDEAGPEGLWTPRLAARIGYCETSCVLCSQVCPTGAIWEITSSEKGWAGGTHNDRPIRIGTAFYDRGRCLPWAMATECIVCEEWCPTSPKAIYLRPAEVFAADGNSKLIKQPWIDPNRCVGCGACEYACPVQDRPAIYVTSIGESRSRTNQFLLNRAKPGSR
ncbi:MAG TPA: 4Fe-4S dicluster domain-containing protein [Candidatus Binatia bacterium]|nr:4Fe-4S dicluster domain-containing protein [Candidatus Binatia bacterium]